ncbi:MAG: MarR family transcriptional regulator [Christensenellaceae bacterium]|nr:MarR family transcriptional regulator [Christensenellaceae bacterium]
MLDELGLQLSKSLGEIYGSIRRVEDKMLRSSVLNITLSELDFLDVIGGYGEKGCSIGEIAKGGKVTMPTVTVAIKKLESKGFVEKIRSDEDGRRVRVILTRMGRKTYAAHRYFHERMVRALLQEVSEDLRPTVLSALQNLSVFLRKIGDAP